MCTLTDTCQKVDMKTDDYSLRKLDELGLLVSDQVTAMLAYWDKNLISRFANNAYREWFGKERHEMIDKMHISELLGPDLYQKNLPYIHAVLAGEKQVFEREIPNLQGTGSRHSLATYIPDIKEGEVIGFFVHVADISEVKKLQQQLTHTKREILRSIINTEENESRRLAHLLRENINQRLAACKMLTNETQESIADSLKRVNLMMADIIDEINSICEELTPSELEIFGIAKTIEITCDKFSLHYPVSIEFMSADAAIEQVSFEIKLAVYRIVQNFINLCINEKKQEQIHIVLSYKQGEVGISLLTKKPFRISTETKEYKAIECRVEYNSGTIVELQNSEQSGLFVRFHVSNEYIG
jgi:PAS domain S-box-containing protein